MLGQCPHHWYAFNVMHSGETTLIEENAPLADESESLVNVATGNATSAQEALSHEDFINNLMVSN